MIQPQSNASASQYYVFIVSLSIMVKRYKLERKDYLHMGGRRLSKIKEDTSPLCKTLARHYYDCVSKLFERVFKYWRDVSVMLRINFPIHVLK